MVRERKVATLSRFRIFILWPLSILLRLWCRTLRFQISQSDREILENTSKPTVLFFWHNRLFAASEVHRRFRKYKIADDKTKNKKRVYGLVSASKDGAWLSAFFKLIGIEAIRGSSSWRSGKSMLEMMHQLQHGHDIAITPDGPRGPCYSFKPGGIILAEKLDIPMFLVSCRFSRAWRIKSWDRFYIPLPFSRIDLFCKLFQIKDFQQNTDCATKGTILRETLMQLNHDF